MADFGDSRHILPAPTTSGQGTGPATSSTARISVACESCKRKKCKCRNGKPGGDPCDACVTSGIECIFDITLDRRRKVATKRTIEELTSHKDLLLALTKAIRNGNDEAVLEQIRQGATLQEIEDTLQDTISDVGEEIESADMRTHSSTMETLLRSTTSNDDSMDLDDHKPHVLDRMQQFTHYKNTMSMLLSSTDSDAENLLRQLRSPIGRTTFWNLKFPVHPDHPPSGLDSSRYLPEMNPSIRSNPTSGAHQTVPWYSRDAESHLIQTSNPSSLIGSTQGGSSHHISRDPTDMSQYIISTERRQRESSRSGEKR